MERTRRHRLGQHRLDRAAVRSGGLGRARHRRGDEHDRHLVGAAARPERRADLEPVDRRRPVLDQGDVERPADLNHGPRLFRRGRRRVRPPLLHLQGEHALFGRVGGDDEDAHPLERQQRRPDAAGQRLGEDRERERGAGIGPGLHPALLDAQLAVHHLDELPRGAQAQDGEPIPGLE